MLYEIMQLSRQDLKVIMSTSEKDKNHYKHDKRVVAFTVQLGRISVVLIKKFINSLAKFKV